MHELPLLMFTLLVQGSVGMTLFLTLSARAASRVPEVKTRLLPGMLIACMAGGLGLVISTLHLGYPLNAFNALRHVASSWLSREIVFASLYLAALGLCTLMMLVRKQLIPLLLPVAAVLGLIDVWCMSAIYAHTAVITWSHFNTWVMFYGAVGVMGAAALAWLPMLKVRSVAYERQTVMRVAAVVVVTILAVRLLVLPNYMAYLASASLSGVVTLPHQPMAIFTQISGLRLCSWAVSILGALLFAISAWRDRKVGLMVGSLLLVLAEVLFRFMFFCIN